MELEYLSKKDAKEYKTEFISKSDNIKKESKDDFSICFSLVGSSKRNMILVREDISDPAFDFDYQLLIMKNKNDKSAEKTKKYFLKLFQQEFSSTEWSVQDSTSAITIKNKNENYSYDVAIMEQNLQTLKTSILKHYKENNDHTYTWEEVSEYKVHKENLKKVKGSNLWSELRDIYKEKKENDSETKSYLLFIESVNDLAQGI